MRKVIPSACYSLSALLFMAVVPGLAQDNVASARVPESAGSTTVLSAPRQHEALAVRLRRPVSLKLDNATLAAALEEINRKAELGLVYSSRVVPLGRRVTAELHDVSAEDALREVLRGTDVDVAVTLAGQIVLVKRAAPDPKPDSGATVTGRVTDMKTGKAIPNVSVFLEGTRWRATTGEDGAYRLVDVAAGAYIVTASRIGYAKRSQSVTVAAGQEVTVDLALQAAASELEQVIVTGTVVPTERKAIPTPISVITADQIEQRGYQRVDQIFRGDIPGAVGWDLGPFDFQSFIYVRGASSLYGGSVKTYIDGIEVAEPFFVAMIDPSSIERIEVLRGPQGSTLYGSQALAGVMQIFTKHGALNTPQPQVEAKVSTGVVQSPWDNTVQQDHSLAVNGGSPDFSYRFGGGFLHNGDWVPHAYSTNANLSASVRGTQGPVTAEFSGRFSSKSFGVPRNPAFYQFGPAFSASYDETQLVKQQTYGLSVNYAASPRWRHTLVLGYDRSGDEFYQNRPNYATPADTFLSVYSQDQTRASVAYHTTYEGSLGPAVQASLTAGADHWTYHSGALYAGKVTHTNNLSSVPGSVSRSQYDNSGYFAQGQLGFSDALYVTAGIRAEDNQSFGRDFGLAWAPRVGVSYVRTMGDVTAKARVAYGKGIRAPNPGYAQTVNYGYAVQMGNPNLGPEQQVGLDGGVEFYFGRRGSLEATYYHQTAIDLIDAVAQPESVYTYEYENVGKIKNTGWEFQGRLNAGRLSLTGTYSITSSVVQELSPTYSGDLRPGDQNLAIPKHTAGATLSYSLPRTAVSLGMTYIGAWTEYDELALYGYFYGGRPYRGSFRAYWTTYPSFAKFKLSVSQTVTNRFSIFLQSDNLTSQNVSEFTNYQFTPGRTTTIGVRVKS